METWNNCKKILCFRPDNLGDVLMTQPAIRALHESFPYASLTLLTSSMGSPIAPYIAEIDDVITLDVPWIKTDQINNSHAILELVEKLKSNEFDGAVIFTNYSQNPLTSAMICYLANIPLRLGYCRENPYQLLTHWVPDKEPFEFVKHGVKRQLDLVKTIGAKTEDNKFHLHLPQDAKKRLLQKLTENKVTINKPFIIVHPGVSEKKRQYPPSLFAQTIALLQKTTHYQILLTGVSSEEQIANFIQQEIGQKVISLVGKLSVDELIALIDISALVISNNTAPVHIAAATQTPVVVLYARTNPEHTPWQVLNRVLCFDVPTKLRSKNTVLGFTTPPTSLPMITPEEIAYAASTLLRPDQNLYTISVTT